MRANILIVEDEESILELIAINLHQSGFNPIRALNAEFANKLIHESIPDLIILDWMLPAMSGIDFIKRLKSNALTKKIPIIMLTARSEEENMIQGLNSGADDYLTKPFSPRELVARIKAILRRQAPELIDEPIKISGLHLDPSNQRIWSNDNLIRMGPTEFKLLYLFMRNPDRVLSRNKILDKVWGNNSDIDDRTVDVHIKRLRASLSEEGRQKLIQTVRGIGYRFTENQEN
jgi:two-component system phosphate regulon response regulator PhoB